MVWVDNGKFSLLSRPVNLINLIYSIFTAKKEDLAKLHKRTINYILEKKNIAVGKD